MYPVRSLIFWALSIYLSNGQRTIEEQQSSLCISERYRMPLFATRVLRMKFNGTRLRQLNIRAMRVQAKIVDPKVAEFEGHRNVIKKVLYPVFNKEQNSEESILIHGLEIQGNYINQTSIDYFIEAINRKNESHRINCSIVLVVSRPERLRDKIFKKAIPFIVMIISIQMGILLDVEVLKELARRPIQVLIGFVCQYGLMPLIALGISKIFRYEPLYGLGLFVVGCCPGGSASNQWTVMFDGDLNLSAFMSFASTVVSFFMMPFWFYTVGQRFYLRQLNIHIPFLNLAISLLIVIGPLAIGMLAVYFIPKLKPIIHRILKPSLILLILYFFVFGLITNYYLFRYIDWITALTVPLLPWLGFLLGGFVALICQQDRKRIITIGIETGIQNVGIAFMVLLYSFPEPQSSQAGIIPLIVGLLSPQPFHLILIYRLIRQNCCKSKSPPPPPPRLSTGTLSVTTRQLSDVEEPPEPIHSAKQISVPLSVLGLSPDTRPTEL